jgi:molecular chaperone DnaK
LDLTLTRAKFNELTAHLVKRPCAGEAALSDAGLSAKQLSQILLVGDRRDSAVQETVKISDRSEPFKGITPMSASRWARQFRPRSGEMEGILLLDETRCLRESRRWAACLPI